MEGEVLTPSDRTATAVITSDYGPDLDDIRFDTPDAATNDQTRQRTRRRGIRTLIADIGPVSSTRGRRARSGLGALALETGGMLVDHGWLRVLGGGDPPLNLAAANGLELPPDQSSALLLVAFVILGGKYAINGGGLPGSAGEVCYFAPAELAWWPMEMGHLDFVLSSELAHGGTASHRVVVFEVILGVNAGRPANSTCQYVRC